MLALVGALVAQTSLAEAGSESDPLTTLALVLAVLAFLIQILVFLFQAKVSNDAVMRSEDLHAQTRGVLEKIEANSSATQKVLFAQFDRLLDYIVGKKARAGRDRSLTVRSHGSRSEEGQSHRSEGTAPQDEHEPLTKAKVVELVDAAVARSTQRPTFSSEVGVPSEENTHILEYMETWASEEEAPALGAKLVQLSPLGLATLVRFGAVEYIQRVSGEEVGLWAKRGDDFEEPTRELMSHGLIRQVGTDLRLTDEGRALWRILPFTKEGNTPAWVREILVPLLRPMS